MNEYYQERAVMTLQGQCLAHSKFSKNSSVYEQMNNRECLLDVDCQNMSV